MEGQTWDDVAGLVNADADIYRDVIQSCAQHVFKEAESLGLTKELREIATNAATISSDELVKIFDLEPHPLARQLVEIAADLTSRQFKFAAQHLNS